MILEILGSVGGLLIIISLLPQLILIIKNKTVENISLKTYIILLLAEIIWTIYGFLVKDNQVIVTNITSGFITSLILIFGTFYYFKNEETIVEDIIDGVII